MKRFVVLCMALAVMLSGCSSGVGGYGWDYVAYGSMTYERPDMAEMTALLERCCDVARNETDLDTVIGTVYEYYDAYDWFYTNYDLAYIEYCRDMTSEYWEEEYAFCAGQSSQVEADLEAFYMALADSPIRSELEGEDYFGAGFFDYYEGEAMWDEELVALMDREAELVNVYYDLSTQAEELEYYSDAYFEEYGEEMCQALVDLVALRQQIAAYMGYDSYVQFAYDFYHYRDYTPEEAMAYMDTIREEMGPLYSRVSQSDVWNCGYGISDERDTFSYVDAAAARMGGITEEAFSLLKTAELYDISHSETKFNTGFELYLTSYYEPYIFLNPTGYDLDKLDFAHEFGHFVTDYTCYGSYAGIDVCEVFSQGMEYLSLCYTDGEEALARFKLADCLETYVVQSAYACFEHLLYGLTGEDLTVEKVFALYEDTLRSFGVDFEGMGWDPRDLVTVPHFYTDPMYVFSYVVSNDAAFQLYQMELQEPGAGLAKFEENLTTDCFYFLEFVEEAGLESPFASGRAAQVAEELAQLLD